VLGSVVCVLCLWELCYSVSFGSEVGSVCQMC